MTSTKTWAYKGRERDGKLVKGKLDAPTQAAALSRMRDMGLSPVSVDESAMGTGLNREINLNIGQAVKLKDLSVMARQMSTMIGAGLSLLRTLHILSEQTDNKTLAKVLTEVRGDIETGGTLSQAFGKHRNVFPPLMIHLIAAGETGGFLDDALDAVATAFEKEVKLKSTVQSAMAYPIVVVGMAIVAVIAMIWFIVPIFEGMFADLGGALPLPTQILVTISANMVWLGPLLIVAAIAFSVWWGKNKHAPEVRAVLDPALLKLPVFGDLLRKIALTRFTRNFAALLKAGVPIVLALQVVGEISGNSVILQASNRIADAVREGRPVAEQLAQEPVFPPMVVQMVAVGEDAGSMELMLSKIADSYDSDIESTTAQMTSIIEPILIAGVGALIGGMIIALYMPVFSIFEQIN
ncbi:type II secretion system F family protein [Agrococcus sp. Marseille-Q4369]|uniref:type II secretion system F family protein n=1 Tax=Agrococcus sp. Marseille-Q4369 TaxID=2810513 RepID=UPI001B8CA0AD|nr:type II secretion system F family protein [Agrococcus sp. Marseille-Q4369]QUW19667.1 type II secretion system F family protein [Agrococcus sp. Marseille-Q4369]